MDRNQRQNTLHSSLLILHPPFFIDIHTPSIIHSAYFNFQPYSRVQSLTLKKPFVPSSFLVKIRQAGRRTDSVLHYTAVSLKENLPNNMKLYADQECHKICGGRIPPTIVQTGSRPDLALVDSVEQSALKQNLLQQTKGRKTDMHLFRLTLRMKTGNATTFHLKYTPGVTSASPTMPPWPASTNSVSPKWGWNISFRT